MIFGIRAADQLDLQSYRTVASGAGFELNGFGDGDEAFESNLWFFGSVCIQIEI